MQFPNWGATSFEQVIGEKFFKKGGAEVGVDAIKGKEVAVLFSCPGEPKPGQPDPCIAFVGELKKFLNEYGAQGGQLQLVLSCPPEGDYKLMAKHFEEDLPDDCLCIPFGDKERRIAL